MTDASELERDLEELFARKAAAVRPCCERVTLPEPAWSRDRGRWAVAAAVVAVSLLAGTMLFNDRGDTVTSGPEPNAATTLPPTEAPTSATPPTDPFDQVVGFAPTEGIPDGWIVVDARFQLAPSWTSRTQQLFGDADAPQPMNRSVLITSWANPYEPAAPPDGPSVLVRGTTASIVEGDDGSLQLQWSSGEILHLATVRGIDESDAVSFIDSLRARPEPSDGFDAAPGTLVEVASEATPPDGQSFLMVLRPVGTLPNRPGPNVSVRASSVSESLEYRAVATPEPDGTLVIREPTSDRYDGVRALRPDGWEVVVTAEVSDLDGPTDPVSTVDAIRAGLRPVTGRELIDAGRALPVSEEADVGGQHIAVHRVDGIDRVICLGDGDSSNCGLAVSVPGGIGAWLLIDDGWVVVARGARVTGEAWDAASAAPTGAPPETTEIPGDEWSVFDVRDDAWWVIVGSQEGGASVNRPLP